MLSDLGPHGELGEMLQQCEALGKLLLALLHTRPQVLQSARSGLFKGDEGGEQPGCGTRSWNKGRDTSLTGRFGVCGFQLFGVRKGSEAVSKCARANEPGVLWTRL